MSKKVKIGGKLLTKSKMMKIKMKVREKEKREEIL
jgi:hypothetical protein